MSCRIKALCGLAEGAITVQLPGMSAEAIIKKDRGLIRPADSSYDVMVLGIAPGRNDDETGLAFQGDVGDKFASFMEASGFDLSKVYVTNIVRCRPPKNRDPARPEIKACLPYFHAEIQAIKPKLIIALGNKAMAACDIDGQGGINNCRGSVYEQEIAGIPCKIMPILHPASFLHRPSMLKERVTFEDYQKAAHIAGHQFTTKKYSGVTFAKYELLNTIEKVRDYFERIKRTKIFAYDTESPSYEWWQNPVMCFSFCIGYPDGAAVLPITSHDPMTHESMFKTRKLWTDEEIVEIAFLIHDVMHDPEITKIGANIKYDEHVVKNFIKFFDLENDENLFRGPRIDIQILAWLIDCHSRIDLLTIGNLQFGYGDYEFDVREIVGHGRKKVKTYDWVPDAVLWPYAATDAEITWRAYELYWPQIESWANVFQYYTQESCPLLDVFMDMEHEGIPYDYKALEGLEDQYKLGAEALEKRLRELAAQVLPVDAPSFNPASPPQVANLLRELGHSEAIADESKVSGFTTSKEVVTELAETDPRLKDLSQFRTVSKFLSTYISDFHNHADALRGRLHFSFKIPGTTSGRPSARLAHQLPRKGTEDALKDVKQRTIAGDPIYRIRDIFAITPAYQDYTFVYADFSQIELRMLAESSGDPGLRQLFADKRDIHTNMTANFLGIPEEGPGQVIVHTHEELTKQGLRIPCSAGCKEVTAIADKENRTAIGKKMNFGISYGSEGANLVRTGLWYDTAGESHNVTWTMVRKGIDRWRQQYPVAAGFKDRVVREAIDAGGWSYSEFGKPRYFGPILENEKSKGYKEAIRELVNHRIQSPSASVLNRSLITLHVFKKRLVSEKRLEWHDYRPVMCVHDSLAYLVKRKRVEWFTEVLKRVLHRPIPELNGAVFPAEIGVGDTLAEAEAKAA